MADKRANRGGENTKAAVGKNTSALEKDAGPDADDNKESREEKGAGKKPDKGQDAEQLADAEPAINEAELKATRKA